MSRGLEVYLGGLKKMLAGVTTTYQTPSLVLQYLVFLGVEVKVEWTREEKVLSRQKKPWQLQNAASALFSATVPGFPSDTFPHPVFLKRVCDSLVLPDSLRKKGL